MIKKTIPVVGMACSSCSANVERKLNSLKGVLSASVNLAGRSALIEYDPSVITLEQMKEAVNGIGFDLVIEQDRSVEEIERRASEDKNFIAGLSFDTSIEEIINDD